RPVRPRPDHEPLTFARLASGPFAPHADEVARAAEEIHVPPTGDVERRHRHARPELLVTAGRPERIEGRMAQPLLEPRTVHADASFDGRERQRVEVALLLRKDVHHARNLLAVEPESEHPFREAEQERAAVERLVEKGMTRRR